MRMMKMKKLKREILKLWGAIGVMLYLGLAGIYLPLTLHSQTKLLYRAPNASHLLSYGPTTLFGTIIQDDLDSLQPTSKHSHTTHCCTDQSGGFVDGLFQLHSPLLMES